MGKIINENENEDLVVMRKTDFQENVIIDKDKFIRQLEQQNLMTIELEEFIENYMRFDNVC